MFSVRIVTTDHYMSSPIPGLDVQYADQRGSEVKRVPVVRIFGATPAGQKTCMHVHGVFPYLYVPYDGTAPWDRYLRQFATSLDKAINVAQGQGQSNMQHVYKVILVSGISMYGYHDKEQQFLKIFMYNPQMIRKAADLLLGGAVLNKPFQPHESHIPYTLQLFIDYNLYGMNMINVAAVKFRRKKALDNDPGPVAPGDDSYSQGSGSDSRSQTSFTALLNRSGSATPSTRTWDWENIPSDLYLDGDVERMSTCDLEVDVVAADILNRLEVTANLGANPGLAALWEDERQRRSEKGESTNITPPESPGRVDIEASDSETILRERLRQIIQDLQPYIDSQSDTETEESQEDDVPLTQASSLHLHLSQDILEGSQDTVMMDEEDEGGTGGAEAVVNVESIHRIVSHSQSFCDVRPEPEVGTSHDKSLVDILAALADDQSSPPASQEAAARILALEEQDSLLSQTTPDPAVVGSQEGNQGQQDVEEDERETMEMSQRVWEGQEQQGDEAGLEFDLAGMDETWTDSQLEQGLKPTTAACDDDDSDADSDIIPQFDGAVDEQPTGLPGKTGTKRLGMRGPVFNMGQQGMSPGGQYGNQGSMGTGSYSPMYSADYSGYSGSQQMSASHRQLGAAYPPNTSVTRPEWTPMYNQGNNPQWSRGGMYGQQQPYPTGGMGGGSQLMMTQQNMQALDSPSMGMQMSPGSSHGAMKSPRNMQQLSPGDMHMDASHSPRSMKQSPGMAQSPGSIPQSPDSIPQSPVYMPQGVMPQQQTGLMQQNTADMTSPTGSQQPSGMNPYTINSPTSQHRPRFPSVAQAGYNQYGQQQRFYGNSQTYSQHPQQQQRYMAESTPGYSGYQQMTGHQRPMSGMYQSQDQYGQQHFAEQRQVSPGRAAGPQGMSMFSGRSQQIAQAPQMSALDAQQNAMYTDPQQQRAGQIGFPRQSQASCMMTSPQGHTPSGTMMGTVSQSTGLKGAHDNFMPRRTSQGGRQMLPQSPDNSPLQFPSLEGQNAMLSSIASRPQTISTATMSLSSSPTGYIVKRPGFARSSSDNIPSPVDSSIGSFQSLDKHPLIQPPSNQMSQHSQDVHKQKASYPQMSDLSPSAQQPSPVSYSSNSMYQSGISQYSHTVAQSSTTSAYTMSNSASPGQYSIGQTQSHNSPQGMTQKQPGPSPGLPDKQQDTYMGPISRFYAQKKTAMYEQISPPATPALETDAPKGNKQTTKSVVGASPSSIASDNQISPLQKLLLEPSTPTVQKPEPNQRSVSRSSLSSVSSANSERLALKHKASPDTGVGSLSDSSKMELKTSTPEKKSTGSPFVPSNLYNMLSDNSTQDNTSTPNLQASLNDSQQDLFADSLLNSPTNENTSSLSLFASDSSQSKPTHSRLQAMLSEPFDNNLQSQLENQKPGNQSLDSSQQFSITNKPPGQAGRGRTEVNYASLSNLQNFVGSVRQDTDYGISFSKRERAFSTEVPSESSFLSQLNDFNDIGPTFPDPPQPQSAGAQPQGNYNFSNWPKFDTVDPNKQVKAAPVVTAKKRGRPPTKKSLSVPGMPVTTTPTSTPTIGKRKRGRPRKNSVNVVQTATSYANLNVMPGTAQQQQSQPPPQQHQQQFSMCQTMGASYAGSSMSNPYQTFPPGHQTFQQMLEDQGDQLPLDPNFGGPMVSDQTQGPTMSQGPPEPTAQYAQISQQFQCNPQFQQGYQHNMQQQQQQQQQQQPTQPSDTFVMQNLDFPQSQNIPQPNKNIIAEPQNDAADFASTVDMSQLYPDTSQSIEEPTFMNMDNQLSQSSIAGSQLSSASNCSLASQDFRTSTLQSINHQNTLVQHNDASRASAVSELMQYRQYHVRPPPKPSPAYTYKFKVPTPVYKRLKVYARRASVEAADVDFVRMHPKDARKYSLLKIGSEIVRLKNLSAACLKQLQEDIKAGKEVQAIPAALRTRTVSLSSQSETTSIMADLLFGDSPKPDTEYTDHIWTRQERNIPLLSNPNVPEITHNKGNVMERMTGYISDNNEENVRENKLDNSDNEIVTKGDMVVESVVQSKEEELTSEQVSVEQQPITQKRQRRPSDAKEKKIKSMFKGNIANIPHLKKYRAGFSYFGKGRVGRGGGKVRQNHPVLGPDFEDDENIILKDVSLIEASDGTLTPIKSRTPIAGRSPAHSGGPMADMEAQDKDLLDSRLKSLYELDLNQSANSQMFQDDLFAEKDMETSEYEGSSDEESETETDKQEPCEIENKEKDKQDITDKDKSTENTSSDLFESSQEEESRAIDNSEYKDEGVEKKTDNSETLELEETIDADSKPCESREIADTLEMKNSNSKPKCDNDGTDKEKLTQSFNGQVDSNSVIDIPVSIEASIMKEVKSKAQCDSKEILSTLKSENCKSDVEMLNEIVKLNRSAIDNGGIQPKEEIDSGESDMNRSDSVDGSVDLNRLSENKKEEQSKVNSITAHSDLSPPERVTSPGPYGDCGKDTNADDLISLKLISKQIVAASRSRSSSSESYSISSRSCSRRNSLARCYDVPKPEMTRRRRTSSDNVETKLEANPKRKKKSCSSNSSACGSKSSRSSSVDKDYKKRRPKAKKKKKSKKRSSRADSDSDGIPGVDYIVINRFKGYKEMKVKIEKLELDNETKTVNVNNLVDQIHEKGTNGFHTDKIVLKESTCQQDKQDDKHNTKPSLPKTGFSAEFEKFLAQQGSHVANLQTTQAASSETISERNQTINSNSTKNSFLEFRVVGGNSTSNCDILSESKPVNNALDDADMLPNAQDFDHKTISRIHENCDTSNTDKTANKTTDLSNELKDGKDMDVSYVMENDEKENEAVEDNVAVEAGPGQADSLGESQFSCLCSSGSVCVCDVNKDVSLAGIRETCSSSEDEKVIAPVRKKAKSAKVIQNNSAKKKKSSAYDRLGGRAFCGRNRKKKSKPKVRSSKLMCTLSMLHDATLEKLTSQQAFNESQNLTLSPMKSKDLSDIDSPDKPKFESPDFELYTDKTDDYRSDFSDTMYKLAYYSPTSSEHDNDSLPRPLSPDEMKVSEESSDNSCSVSKEHPEKKLTLGDIMKSFSIDKNNSSNSSTGNITSKPNDGIKNGFKANIFEPSILKDNSIKTAVAKEAPMTLKDIMSMSQDEVENAHGLPKLDTEVSSPPDLGPPVMESFSPCPDIIDDNSPPPHLTPKRLNSQSEDQDDSYLSKPYSPRIPDLTDCKHMPMLTPCRSPRLPLSPRQKPGPEKHANFPDETKMKPGRSPGASSSGSINVVHSEQFSDISDESEVDDCSSTTSKPQCLPTNMSPQHNNYENISPVKDPYSADKDQKLKEIREFEERMKKSDENKNNIFELLSYKHGADYIPHKSNHHLSNSFSQQSPKEAISPLDFSFCELNKNKDYDQYNEPQDFRVQKNKDDITDSNTTSFMPYKMVAKPECRIDRTNHISHPNHSALNRTYPPLNGFSSLPEPGEICRGFRRYPYSSSVPYSTSSHHMPLTTSFTQRNIFDNFSTNFSQYDPPSYNSQSLEIDAHSGDLFDSLTSTRYTKSHTSSNHPSIFRSLSDSFKTEYSFIRDQKINNNIMRTVENHFSLKEKQRNSPVQHHNGAVPFLDFHGGSSRSQRRNKSANQNTGPAMSQQSAINLSYSSRRQNEGETPGHGFPERRRSITDLDTRGCHVIMPLTPPPTRESISRTSFDYGFPSVPSRQAFYGDYRDAPDKPREGGAQVLKVPSTLVKDLEEFETSLNLTGLKNWRTMLCMNDSILSSQESADTITNRLQKEPALKYVLTGDQSVIITPCLTPPVKSVVHKWCKGRKLYKDLKNQAIQKKQSGEGKVENKDNNEEKETSEKNSEENKTGRNEKEDKKRKEEVLTKSEPGMARLNLFTGKREHADEITEETEERESKYTKLETDRGDKTVDTEQAMTPERDTGMVHSTPVVLRRKSTDLFEPECTPITSSGRRGSQDAESSMATPRSRRHGSHDIESTLATPISSRRVSMEVEPSMTTPRRRLSRRLSTNTEKMLRRTILTSQMKQQFCTPALQRAQTTQIEGPSLKNSFGFRISQQHGPDAKALHEYQHLTALSVEIHAESRGDLRPDPEIDAVQAIFYTLFNDIPPNTGTRHETGVFILDSPSADIQEADSSAGSQKSTSSQSGPSTGKRSRSGVKGHDKTLMEKSAVLGFKIHYARDEQELLQKFIEFINSWDPDILVGYEIQMLSWGYLLQRASTLGVNMTQAISRVPSAKHASHHSAAKDEYGADHMSEIHIAGRIVLNLWRLLRHEVTLNVYSFENVAFHVLHKRIPLFPFRNLTAWFKHRTHVHRWKVIEHYITRVKGNMDLIDQLDLIGRTSEFARVFGIEFYHVLSRGSQYRVESMMLRVAKPLNFVPASPSVQQRARMKAPECIPLTLEPESRFYTDPVVVLDFQSLYPSIMIAYNYCFSTCLGRLEWFQNAHEGPIEFGCVSLNLPASVIQKHENDVTISPNGVVFCTSKVRRGVLPIMVEEILKTRLMVKKAMGRYKGDRTMTRMLHARQMGLKLIANVTYGYTGANFSGRMPCIEVADSIVRKARETLERSIKLIEDTPRWGAKVVYGDTDSMFLQMKGRSKDEAFKIGQEIADTVTKMFPKPIKLKFEKVYLPCVLQTKKRYVGFMYETPDQKEPVYDAKGIETVRRDSCSAVSKMLEQSIKILFSSYDVSQVKTYVQRQFQKIMEGTVSLQDFIFAKEYRGMMGYKPGACVPALEISKKLVRQDRRSEPRTGERVPYVIVYGSPGLPLIQLVRQPLELIQDPALRLNSTYYITKQILPPLDRFLFLLGVDVFSWYQDMPHSAGRLAVQPGTSNQGKKGTISQYFATSSCPICEKQTKRPVCVDCMKNPQMVCVTLNTRITQWERVHNRLEKICSTCVGCQDPSTYTSCVSLDCPVMYRKARAAEDMNRVQGYRDILDKIFK